MKFLHTDFDGGSSSSVIVTLNNQANVMLLSDAEFWAISEFPKGRKYLISLSFRGKASVRPAQVGGFDVNIVIHGSTAVRGRGDLVAYRWALWKLTAPWTHRTRPPHLGKRCAFSTSSTGPFPSNHSRKTPKGPEIALGNPDRPEFCAYRGGRRFQYHGGWAATSPVRLRPPSAGHLHVVVDLGGRAGQVRAGIRVMQDRG